MFTDGVDVLVQEQYNYEAVVKGELDNKYRVHSLPGGGVKRGVSYAQGMKEEITEEMGIQLSAKEISTYEFQNYLLGNNKLMRIYKILIPLEELQGVADQAKAYQAALPQKFLKGGESYQEVYTSYTIPLN